MTAAAPEIFVRSKGVGDGGGLKTERKKNHVQAISRGSPHIEDQGGVEDDDGMTGGTSQSDGSVGGTHAGMMMGAKRDGTGSACAGATGCRRRPSLAAPRTHGHVRGDARRDGRDGMPAKSRRGWGGYMMSA